MTESDGALTRPPVPPPPLTICTSAACDCSVSSQGFCVAQWAQLFPLTPRAHVTQARREWERDRHPDICLRRIGGVQTHTRCEDMGSLQKGRPARTGEVFIHPYVGSRACMTSTTWVSYLFVKNNSMKREGKQGTDVMWKEPRKITQKIDHSLHKDSQKRNKTHNKNFSEKS